MIQVRANASDQYTIHPAVGLILPRKQKAIQLFLSFKVYTIKDSRMIVMIQSPVTERYQDRFLVEIQLYYGDLTINDVFTVI